MSFNDAAIFSLKGNDYKIIFWQILKDHAINAMKKNDLKEKSGSL